MGVFNAETLAEVELINTPEIAEQDRHEDGIAASLPQPSACMEQDMAALKEDIHEAFIGWFRGDDQARNH